MYILFHKKQRNRFCKGRLKNDGSSEVMPMFPTILQKYSCCRVAVFLFLQLSRSLEMFAEILRVIVMLENFQGIDFWLISHSIPLKRQVKEDISSFSGTTSPVITFLQESFTAFKLHFLHSTCVKELCLREEQNYFYIL